MQTLGTVNSLFDAFVVLLGTSASVTVKKISNVMTSCIMRSVSLLSFMQNIGSVSS